MLLLGCALLTTARGARAEEPRVALSLNWIRLPGAEDCIDAAELARTVEQQLGRSVFVSPTWATRLIEGWSEPMHPGWRVVLRASDAEGNTSGQRELTSSNESCSSLNRSIVLAVGLLAQSARGIAYEPPEKAAAKARSAEHTPLADARPHVSDRGSAPAAKTLSTGQAEFGATSDLGWGVLPKTSVGVGGRAAIGVSSAWMAELSSTIWIPQLVEAGWAYATFSRIDVALGMCAVLAELKDARLSACAGPMFTAVQANGLVSAASEAPYFGTYARIAGSWGLSELVWVTASLGGSVPFSSSIYYFNSDPTGPPPGSPSTGPQTWTTPKVAGSGQLGLVLHFGP